MKIDEATSGEGPADTAWDLLAADDAPLPEHALVVDVEGFEGPLDLLLALARTQKVDISRISIVTLVDQYLEFIGEAQKLRLEIAADYLVMAAWLAFLKSRLLLPREENIEEQLSAEEAAQRLAFRLMRLQAMRDAAARLMTMKRLGRDVFARGWRQPVETVKETCYTAEIIDLLKAYSDRHKRTVKVAHVVKARTVWSIKDARKRLERLIGESLGRWVQLDLFLVQYMPSGEAKKMVLASAFGASLEMAREGVVELRQEAPFAPLFMRPREKDSELERAV